MLKFCTVAGIVATSYVAPRHAPAKMEALRMNWSRAQILPGRVARARARARQRLRLPRQPSRLSMVDLETGCSRRRLRVLAARRSRPVRERVPPRRARRRCPRRAASWTSRSSRCSGSGPPKRFRGLGLHHPLGERLGVHLVAVVGQLVHVHRAGHRHVANLSHRARGGPGARARVVASAGRARESSP